MSSNYLNVGRVFSQDLWNTLATVWDEMTPSKKLIAGGVILTGVAAGVTFCRMMRSAWQRDEQETLKNLSDRIVEAAPPNSEDIEALKRLQSNRIINDKIGSGGNPDLTLMMLAVKYERLDWYNALIKNGGRHEGMNKKQMLTFFRKCFLKTC